MKVVEQKAVRWMMMIRGLPIGAMLHENEVTAEQGLSYRMFYTSRRECGMPGRVTGPSWSCETPLKHLGFGPAK